MKGSVLIMGEGVAQSCLATFAQTYEMMSADGSAPAAASVPVVLLRQEADGQGYLDALMPPVLACLQVEGEAPPPFDATWLAPLLRGGQLLSLLTRTAYYTDLSHTFTNQIAARLALPDPVRRNVAMALQEALANALIHGNLELESSHRQSVASFRAYNTAIRERLADPQFGGRRLVVAAFWDEGPDFSIMVHDQGPGFDPNSVVPTLPSAEGKTGRGLLFIRDLALSVTFSDKGRCVSMRFARQPAPTEGPAKAAAPVLGA